MSSHTKSICSESKKIYRNVSDQEKKIGKIWVYNLENI